MPNTQTKPPVLDDLALDAARDRFAKLHWTERKAYGREAIVAEACELLACNGKYLDRLVQLVDQCGTEVAIEFLFRALSDCDFRQRGIVSPFVQALTNTLQCIEGDLKRETKQRNEDLFNAWIDDGGHERDADGVVEVAR